MEIKIHSIKFDANQKLLEFIENKAKKFGLFYDKIVEIEIFLRLDKNQNTENKVVEIKLIIPGNDLFAKKQCKTFEEATDQVASALEKQLKKYKDKIKSN